MDLEDFILISIIFRYIYFIDLCKIILKDDIALKYTF